MSIHPSAHAYRIAVIVAVGITSSLLAFGFAAAPSRAGGRLGLRGLKRQRAIAKSAVWRAVEPFVRWLGVRLSGLLSDSFHEKLDQQISRAGDLWGLTAEEYVALAIVSAISGMFVAVAVSASTQLSLNLALILFVPVGAALPYMQISGTGQDRLVAIGRGLPFVVDLMAMAMSAGIDFPGAVRQVVEKAPKADDPIIEELTLLLQGLQIGRSRREVLEELARRAPCDQVVEFTGAVIQAEQRGNPLADVLQIQASTYRTRRSLKGEEAASKAGVQMTAPLFLVFVSVLLLVMGPMIVKIMNMQ
jgi:tight adherence protein C